jgi:preprotein translocase subunit SecE
MGSVQHGRLRGQVQPRSWARRRANEGHAAMSEVADREDKKERTGPVTFFKEVRQEARKVTWATRQEVTVATVMVLILTVAAAIFFGLADFLIGSTVNFILRTF